MLVTLRLVGDSPSARKCMVLFAELWFYVILPNLYLMNTAHNKDRIIDDGLLSTIKNGLVLPLGLNICFCLPSRWRICVNSQEQTSNITGVQSATHKNILEMSTKKVTPNNAALGTEIYTISKSLPALNLSEKRNHFTTSDACGNPSTSNKTIEGERRCHVVPFVHKHLSESDQEEDNTPSQNQLHLNNLESMLCILRKSIDNEDNYLFYFAQLADYTSRVRKTDLVDKNFKIVNISKSLRPYDIPTSNRKGKTKKRIQSPEMLFHNSTLKHRLIGKLSSRISLRRNMLENFPQYCIDKTSYDRCINNLIDLEESFVLP